MRQVSSVISGRDSGREEWRWTVVAKGGTINRSGQKKTRQAAMEEAGWMLEYLTQTEVGSWERTS